MIKFVRTAIFLSLIFSVVITYTYAAIPPDIVVAAWTFEGDGVVVEDISGNGHSGEIVGDAQRIGDGQFGKAILFPGDVSSYIQVPDHPDLNITDSISLMAWFKGTVNGGDLIGKDEGPPSTNRHYNIHITGTNAGKLYLSGTTVTSVTPIIDDEWHHVVGTWDGETAQVYIDGELEAEQAFAGQLTESQVPVEMGRRSVQGLTINGIVDDVAIFNAGLTEAQVKEIMENGLAAVVNAAVDPAGKLTTTWANIK
jgi:hypothetical protein